MVNTPIQRMPVCSVFYTNKLCHCGSLGCLIQKNGCIYTPMQDCIILAITVNLLLFRITGITWNKLGYGKNWQYTLLLNQVSFCTTFSGMSFLLKCSIMQMPRGILSPRALCSCMFKYRVLKLIGPSRISSFGMCSKEASKQQHEEPACIWHSKRNRLAELRIDLCRGKPRGQKLPSCCTSAAYGV